jgi:hypothetical protein
MIRFFAFLALCWCAFRAYGASLLVLTEPTARGLAGGVFDRWLAQVQREGWTVTVREVPRWGGDWSVQDWTTLNRMSNEVVRVDPDAVQLVGHLPWLKTGEHSVDGHATRCITTHQWLSCLPGLTLTDTANHTGMGYDAGLTSPLVATNLAGDGIPDETYGTFVRPVSFIDAAGLTYASATFASGYLAGTNVQPAIDEGLWLRRYFTNNLAHRQQRGWPVTETGYCRTDGWLNYATVTATNNSVSWTTSTASLAGRTDRWIHHSHELGIWSPNLVTDEGVWARVFFAQIFKSYGMEESVGQATYRRHLFPGWTDAPLALVAGWGLGSASSAVFFWMAKSTDATVADAITSSATRYGGVMPWEYPIVGDVTLPMDNAELFPTPGAATVGTLIIQ